MNNSDRSHATLYDILHEIQSVISERMNKHVPMYKLPAVLESIFHELDQEISACQYEKSMLKTSVEFLEDNANKTRSCEESKREEIRSLLDEIESIISS